MIHSAQEFVELRENNDPRATYDNCQLSVWQDVIQHYPEFKAWVIHNKTVPSLILRLLSHDPDSSVRFSVAMKRKCPEDVLESLAHDNEESVRVRVAWNANTPLDILKMLCNDPCVEVAEVASGRLNESRK